MIDFHNLYEEMYGTQPNNGKKKTDSRLHLLQAVKEAIKLLPQYVSKDNLSQCNFPNCYGLEDFYNDFCQALCFYLNGDLKKDTTIISYRSCFGDGHEKSGQLFHDPNGCLLFICFAFNLPITDYYDFQNRNYEVSKQECW
jgi:hypothetical protein